MNEAKQKYLEAQESTGESAPATTKSVKKRPLQRLITTVSDQTTTNTVSQFQVNYLNSRAVVGSRRCHCL